MAGSTRRIMEPVNRDAIGAWWMVGVLLGFYVLSMADRLVFTLLVDPIKADLGLTDFQLSIILGPAFSMAYAVAGFPLGWMVDRWPRRIVQFWGVVGWSLAAAGMGFADSFNELLLARVAMGVFEASAMPAALSLIADRFAPARLTTAVAAYGMGPKLGTTAAFVVGGALLGLANRIGPVPLLGTMLAPWQLTLVIAGLPGIPLAFLVFTFREPRRQGGPAARAAEGGDGLGRFLRARARVLVPLFGGFFTIGLAAFALINWVPAYMTRSFGWSAPQFGPILGTISLLGALSLMIKGWIVDLLFARGRRDIHLRFFLWLLVVSTPMLAAAFLTTSPVVFLALYGVVSVVALSYLVYCSAVLQLLTPPHLRGRMAALIVLLCSALPSAIAPMLVAGIGDFLIGGANPLAPALAGVSVGTAAITIGLLALALKPLRRELADPGPA